MQHVKLCSESVENSSFLELGASSSDMADVWLDSSSTTGAVEMVKVKRNWIKMWKITRKQISQKMSKNIENSKNLENIEK